MIFHSGDVQGLARLYHYHIASSDTSVSGAGGAPLSILRSLYQTVRRSGGERSYTRADKPEGSSFISALTQKPF
jgi:hypothetical protein